MAQISYSLNDLPKIPGAKIAIVMSKWYRECSESMAARCSDIIEAAGGLKPESHVLPGCIEIPLAVRRLLRRDPSLEAVVVFGVIVKGDTYHFDMVKDLSVQGLQTVMFECDVPIINEILPVDRIEDAVARSSNDDKNKGIEAARAAVEIIHWRRRHPL